jgi:polysaccharide biosynthesis protein PslH
LRLKKAAEFGKKTGFFARKSIETFSAQKAILHLPRLREPVVGTMVGINCGFYRNKAENDVTAWPIIYGTPFVQFVTKKGGSSMIRTLCISHCLPYPASTGGHQRTALLLQALEEYGPTDLIQVSRHGPLPREMFDECREHFNLIASVDPVQRGTYRPWNLVRRLHPRFVDRLANTFGSQAITYQPDPNVRAAVQKAMSKTQYDVIVGRHLYPTAMAGLLEESPGIPVLIDLDDVDHLVARETSHYSIPLIKRMAFAMQRPQIERAVPRALRGASHLWIACQEDGHALERGTWSWLPNIPYAQSKPIKPCPPAKGSLEILLVATFGYAPNNEALEHFLSRNWPAIRRAVPGATVRIVGTGIRTEQRDRWSAIRGVEVVGFVEDLREEYARCAFAVVPVQRGGGTKIKAIECFAYGRTCVVAPHSHRGIESILRHGESLWLGKDDASFAEGCICLLSRVDARNAMAARGNALVRQHYSLDRFRDAIREGLARFGLVDETSEIGHGWRELQSVDAELIR